MRIQESFECLKGEFSGYVDAVCFCFRVCKYFGAFIQDLCRCFVLSPVSPSPPGSSLALLHNQQMMKNKKKYNSSPDVALNSVDWNFRGTGGDVMCFCFMLLNLKIDEYFMPIHHLNAAKRRTLTRWDGHRGNRIIYSLHLLRNCTMEIQNYLLLPFSSLCLPSFYRKYMYLHIGRLCIS